MLQKLGLFGALGFAIFFVSQRPSAAGDGVRAITDLMISVANGFADFAGNIIP